MKRLLSASLVLALTILVGPAVLLSGAQAHPVSPQAESRNESRIAREARHQLLMLPYYTVFDNLEYSVQGNTVVLKGQVTNPTLKSDAENAVRNIEGVERVDNQIQVLAVSPMDDQIRRAEYRAIYGDPNLSRYGFQAMPSIHIIVNNGHVTLTGVVDSEADKNVAGIRANGVPNVFGVTNDLQVTSSSNYRSKK